MSHAQQHSSSSEDSSLFSSALGFLQGNKQQIGNSNLDESQAVKAHQNVYGGGGQGQQHDSQTLGAGAAMQALKMFTGGGAGSGGQGSQGGGNSQNQFIGMAMGQASKLFDQQSASGNVVSLAATKPDCVRLTYNALFQDPNANKQDVVKSAAEMALKMYMKGQIGGGGGPGGLMGLAGKFM